MTGGGAIPVLFFKRVSDRLLDVMLGFAAGVMLASSSFSLIVPAIELGGVWITVVGLSHLSESMKQSSPFRSYLF